MGGGGVEGFEGEEGEGWKGAFEFVEGKGEGWG